MSSDTVINGSLTKDKDSKLKSDPAEDKSSNLNSGSEEGENEGHKKKVTKLYSRPSFKKDKIDAHYDRYFQLLPSSLVIVSHAERGVVQ
ncbi:hypothetical protein Avbf_11048, partial [Armadillidium vulgare]